MPGHATLDLDDFPASPADADHWLHDDGRVFFLWPARERATEARVRVEVEVTGIRLDGVADQLRPSRKSIERAARELYHPGSASVRLLRADRASNSP